MLSTVRPLFPYLKKYWPSYAVGTLAVFLNNGIWILFPLIIRKAIDDLNRGVTHEKLATYSLALVAVAAGKGIFQFLTRWILIGISREIEFDMRNDLFRNLESLSYDFYQRTRTGDIMARATNDLNAVRMLLGPAIMYSANTIVFTAGALIFMISISPKLTMWAFLPLPIASIVVQYFGKRIHERFERIQAMFSDISAKTQENFSGARVIRAYAQEEAEIKSFEKSNLEYINRSLKLVRLMGMLWPTLETMLGFAIVLVLWLGGREVLLGHITVGGFVAFNTYMVQLTWPIIALGWVINIFAAHGGRPTPRAVIRDPKILVLDDALASVDTQTEEHILNHLREVMNDRTTIFISHRVSTVRNADRIAVLHDGKIVEYGTHDELLLMNGYYTDLHNKQLLEEELETV